MNNAIQPLKSMSQDRCWVSQGIWGTKTCEQLAVHYHCSYCPQYKAAAANLLDQPIPETHLSERTEYYGRPRESARKQTGSILVFRLGKEWFGIPPHCVQEVTAPRKIHSIPHRPTRILLGVANIRGELLLCISLSEFLGIKVEDQSNDKSRLYPRWLVINHEGRRLVFPSNEVQEIIHYSESDLLPLPATLEKGAIHFTHGMLLWHYNMVGCLDMQRLFSALIQHLS